MRNYWSKVDVQELQRLGRKAKTRGQVLDIVKVSALFNRTPLAIFHKLTSLGLMHDASRTVLVWARNIQDGL